MIELRDYQRQAVEAVYDHLIHQPDENPCVVIPTGGGKTPVIATMCSDLVQRWDGRVLCLAHVKELLEQTADKLRTICPEVPFGVYSAGLKRRDRKEPVIVAGIQSIWKRAKEFDPFDLVIVDEAHLIGMEGEGMYRRFLKEAKALSPDLRIVGLTATPYRLKDGPICTPKSILNRICYEIGVRDLIEQGYLSPLVAKASETRFNTDGLGVRGGEFISEQAEALMNEQALVQAACDEIVCETQDRAACLIFATSVAHGQRVAHTLRERCGVDCGFVSGETEDDERLELLADFKAGRLKYLCNVNVLTTGFDAPQTDCVALLRPTMSPGLLYQMIGRGFRIHPAKRDCLVLDFGGNIMRLGPVDDLQIRAKKDSGSGQAPAKECPKCRSLMAVACHICSLCGYVFPPPPLKTLHSARASTEPVLSRPTGTEWYVVQETVHSIHQKRNGPPDARPTMRVDYKVGWHRWKSEWICFEHSGRARRNAERWWLKRSRMPIPGDVSEAVAVARGGGVAETKRIETHAQAGELYDRIVGYELGDIPEPINLDADPVVASVGGNDFPFGIDEEVTPW